MLSTEGNERTGAVWREAVLRYRGCVEESRKTRGCVQDWGVCGGLESE